MTFLTVSNVYKSPTWETGSASFKFRIRYCVFLDRIWPLWAATNLVDSPMQRNRPGPYNWLEVRLHFPVIGFLLFQRTAWVWFCTAFMWAPGVINRLIIQKWPLWLWFYSWSVLTRLWQKIETVVRICLDVTTPDPIAMNNGRNLLLNGLLA